ncbi:MAG: hypothetical protein RID09_11810 [Coleofasciculus sp. G1-WW12-02]|uniref:hypothetical protein n=1 Tax=Coleofasciculus sp. G1-WW12-02 TaxID=3068483 RepID=UPI0032F2C707
MKTDFESFKNKDLFRPVIFRTDFNNFDSLTLNQAWSLFFTAGQEDKVLGLEPELGRFFNNLLIAVGVMGTLTALFISSIN